MQQLVFDSRTGVHKRQIRLGIVDYLSVSPL